MEYVYVVVENIDIYTMVYKSYASAHAAVKEKYKDYLQDLIKESGDLESIEKILADVNVDEHSSGKTTLYIEKGINIVICKLYISV
jgi:hypothetical protein